MVRKYGSQPPSQIGNYTLLKQIGRGAFSLVYLAKHTFLNYYAAIKLLDLTKDITLSDELRQTLKDDFYREAFILKDIRHPHILSLHDFGSINEVLYIIVEYASLGTLRERIKSVPLTTETALTILKQVGSAVHTVHEHNIIHCDLKPENILFDDKNDAKLADFGIAVRLDEERVSQVRGTYAYMAPELFEGSSVTKESDQYSLGCIAYELFTGCHPFETISPFSPEDLQIMANRHKNTPPPSIKQFNTNISVPIELATNKALAKRPMERHTSVDVFIKSLQLETIPSVSINTYATLPPLRDPLQALQQLQLQKDLTDLLSPLLWELGLSLESAQAWDTSTYKQRTYSMITTTTGLSHTLVYIPHWILEDENDASVNAIRAMATVFSPSTPIVIFSPSLHSLSPQIQNVLENEWSETCHIKAIVIAERKIKQLQNLKELIAQKIWITKELQLHDLLQGGSTDELSSEDSGALIDIIAQLPSVTDEKGRGRRMLLEGAGLKHYIRKIELSGDSGTFAEEVIGKLQDLKPRGVKPGYEPLGLLLLSLLDSSEPSTNEKELIKRIIRKYKLAPLS